MSRRRSLLRELSASAAIALLAALAIAGPLIAQAPKRAEPAPPKAQSLTADPLLSGEPGYVDVAAFDVVSADDLEMHVSVKGPLLQLVANASRDEDPDLAKALAALAGIEVRVYSVAEKRRSRVRGGLEHLADRLTDSGWSAAITVQVAREHGYAMLRMVDGEPLGLVAFYLTEDNQAIFVNIVGRIDTATVGQLARKYDLDLLAVPADPDGN